MVENKKEEDESKELQQIMEHFAQLGSNATKADNLQVDFEREERAVLQSKCKERK